MEETLTWCNHVVDIFSTEFRDDLGRGETNENHKDDDYLSL